MDLTNDTATAGGHASLPTYEAASDTAQCKDAILGEGDLIDQNVPLASLRLDCGTQWHAAMNDAAIAEYTEAIHQGATLPPLVVYFDGVDFWLADGYHRFHAYRAAGVDEVAAEVRTGTRRDAVLFSTHTMTPIGMTHDQETAHISKPKPAAPFNVTEQPALETGTAPASAGDVLAKLRAEITALRGELDDMKASFADTLADNEVMGRAFDADDRVKASMDEARLQKALADNAECTLATRSQEFIERARDVVYWKNRAAKAEKLLGKAA